MPSILVADDEIIFYLELQQQLCSWGHKVFLANSGEEAVQLAIQEKPDLILMDIMMPGGMNGMMPQKSSSFILVALPF
jgi:CheY-like chemotaxis protein